MVLPELEQRDLPEAPKFRNIIGPSFIFLGLGLGSGELILWPYLVSRFGLGIIWGAAAGITLQWFMNMEIERYALVRGESVLVGFARKWRLIPVWFVVSTLLPWIWPGIIATTGVLWAQVLGLGQAHYVTIALLVAIGLMLTLGPVVYTLQEKLQRSFILLGAPFILVVTIILAKAADWGALATGLVGRGDGYNFLPASIPLASFLAAFAYSGAGGNLNLAQSYYVREKGYGMGQFMGRITSVITGKAEQWRLTGMTFAVNPANLSRFKRWWRVMNWEHGLIFWGAGLATILLIALLAYSTTSGLGKNSQGVNFVIAEANVIGQRLAPWVGTVFLVIVGLFLFGTQLSVLDASSRILAENWLLLWPNLGERRLRGLFYVFLWLQIGAGIMVLSLGLREPLLLLTIGAVLNAVAMLVHSGLTLWLNTTSLPPALQPNWWRRGALSLAVGGFAILSFMTVVK
jgi:hypothetical protein